MDKEFEAYSCSSVCPFFESDRLERKLNYNFNGLIFGLSTYMVKKYETRGNTNMRERLTAAGVDIATYGHAPANVGRNRSSI